MEEILENNVVVEESATASAPVEEKEKAFDKIKSKIALILSPERRKKTIVAAIITVVVVVVLCTFFTLTNPKNIAERYVKASINGNERVCSQLEAFDNKEDWLRSAYYGNGKCEEEDFFDKKSNEYDADINSWNDFYSVIKAEQQDYWEDRYGKYKITTKVTRSKDMSEKKIASSSELGSLDYLERCGFDSNETSAYKKVTVSAKISGEDNMCRLTYYVYLAKVHGFWKVLGTNIYSDDI